MSQDGFLSSSGRSRVRNGRAAEPTPPSLLQFNVPDWVPALPDRPWLPPSWGDVLIVLLAAIPATLGAIVDWRLGRAGSPLVVAACLILPVLALGLRRRYPSVVLAIALVAAALGTLLDLSSSGSLAAFVALYTMGTLRQWRAVAAATAVAVTLAVVATALTSTETATPLRLLGTVVGTAVLYGFAAALGLYFGTRRAYVRAVVDRAERLEAEREMLARQAVMDERTRIARELHDVVAHHVSLMVIEAGAAESVLPAGADRAAASLRSIQSTGRLALDEMVRLLEVLRSSDEQSLDAPVSATEGRQPQPSLDDLPTLLERTRAAGLDVALQIEGEPYAIPNSVDLSVYRIVQEALTNALRHAGRGTHASVRIRYGRGVLEAEISDDGRSRTRDGDEPYSEAGSSGRHGLVGMRERVALFGGRFSAGPLPGRGFRVHIVLPVEPAGS